MALEVAASDIRPGGVSFSGCIRIIKKKTQPTLAKDNVRLASRWLSLFMCAGNKKMANYFAPTIFFPFWKIIKTLPKT